MLCDDVIFFRPAKKSHAVCIGTAFSFLLNAIRVKNLFKENLKTLKTTKEATKKEQARRSRWTRKRGSKPLKNLTGAANLQSKSSPFLAPGLCKVRMRTADADMNRIKYGHPSQLCNKSMLSRMLTKQASHGPESKLLEMSDREQIVSYTRALR